jgi:hypothetical protein
MSLVKENQKSVRVVLNQKLYDDVKARCLDYGDISKIVRHLLRKWVAEKGSLRAIYEEEEALKTEENSKSK